MESHGLDLLDSELVRPLIKDYSETVKAHGNLSSATNVSLEDGNVHTLTVAGAFTLTLTGEPVSGTAGSITLIITNGGSSTLTWDTAINWASGTAPTLTTAGIDVLVFITVNSGIIWNGFTSDLNLC